MELSTSERYLYDSIRHAADKNFFDKLITEAAVMDDPTIIERNIKQHEQEIARCEELIRWRRECIEKIRNGECKKRAVKCAKEFLWCVPKR